MKIYKLILSVFLLTSFITYSQMKNKMVVSEYEETKMVTDNNETIWLEQSEVSKEITPFLLDPEDKNKLNQDVIYLPTQVTKTLRLNCDEDFAYDKKATLSYLKSQATNLKFTLNIDGLEIETENDKITIDKILSKNEVLFTKIKNPIVKDGLYEIFLSNGEQIQLNVTNFITIN